MISFPQDTKFDYITRRTQDVPEQRSTHLFDSYPEDLRKKVVLLHHFKNYMVTDWLERREGATTGESNIPRMCISSQITSADSSQVPYVKKWTRNRHAIMFQLSNKIVQVVFFDKTEIVLSSRSQTVTYVDKKAQVVVHPLCSVMDVHIPELAKRLRFTKDILVNLLGPRSTDTQ